MTTAQPKDIHDELRERDFFNPAVNPVGKKSNLYERDATYEGPLLENRNSSMCALARWLIFAFGGDLSDGNRQGPMDSGDDVTLRPLREQSKAVAKCSVS
jgi:hypothetical protein